MTASRLYLVDDEEVIRRSLGLMLRMAGYEVQAFASGPELLEAAGGLEPGCILLDVRMPDMDGLEVQRELARRAVDWPVVIMTGHGDIAVAVAALKAGAEDFVEKPFDRTKIVEAVERARLRLIDPAAHAAAARAAARELDVLTEIEAKVLAAFAEGLSNQAVAAALGIDLAAVEAARAALTAKLRAESLVDAIRIAHLAGRAAGPHS